MKVTLMTEAEKDSLSGGVTTSITADDGAVTSFTADAFVSGSTVFCTDSSKLYVYTGSEWKSITMG